MNRQTYIKVQAINTVKLRSVFRPWASWERPKELSIACRTTLILRIEVNNLRLIDCVLY